MRLAILVPAGLLCVTLACGQNEGGFHVGTDDKEDFAGQPAMVVSAVELVFDEVPVGSARSLDFVIENQGNADLLVDEVILTENDNLAFYLDAYVAEGLTIVPGADVAVVVGCSMSAEGRVEGVLRVASNDGTNPTFDVPLVAITEGWEDTGS